LLLIRSAYGKQIAFHWKLSRMTGSKILMTQAAPIPPVVEPLRRSKLIGQPYHNESLARINDHEIRMSVMTEQFRWHRLLILTRPFTGSTGNS